MTLKEFFPTPKFAPDRGDIDAVALQQDKDAEAFIQSAVDMYGAEKLDQWDFAKLPLPNGDIVSVDVPHFSHIKKITFALFGGALHKKGPIAVSEFFLQPMPKGAVNNRIRSHISPAIIQMESTFQKYNIPLAVVNLARKGGRAEGQYTLSFHKEPITTMDNKEPLPANPEQRAAELRKRVEGFYTWGKTPEELQAEQKRAKQRESAKVQKEQVVTQKQKPISVEQSTSDSDSIHIHPDEVRRIIREARGF